MSSSTWVTGTPAAAIRAAVEPVETISTPGRVSAAGQLLQPGLVVDAISARRIGAAGPSRPLVVGHGMRDLPSARCGPALAGQPADDVDEQPALDGLDALVQARLVVVVAAPAPPPGR